MPAPPPLRISLTVDDVRLVREGQGRPCSARILDTAATLLDRVKDGHWLRPAHRYALWPVAAAGSGCLRLRGWGALHSPLAAHRLCRATHVAAGICTIGSRVGQQVREWFAAGEAVKAVVLDEIGSLALYRLAEDLEGRIRLEARRLGLEASGVLNPGDDGFDISEQPKVIELAGGARMGVSLTAGGMLCPEKSLTLIMGIGKGVPAWGRDRNCARCRARRRCPHRHLVPPNLAA